MNTRNYIRSIQPELHDAAEHHAVHGIELLTEGDIIAYKVKVDAVRKAIRDLREFQVLHEGSAVADAVRGLMERPARFPSTDEHL